MEHIIGSAQSELAPVDLNLTSKPERVAANEMYRKLGFERRGECLLDEGLVFGDSSALIL